MPFAVTHILTPIVLLEVLKKRSKRLKKAITPNNLLVAGIFGLLPDIDVVPEMLFYALTGNIAGFHRGFTHSLFIPFVLLLAGLFLYKKPPVFFAAFGWATHIVLDFIFVGDVPLFYPFSSSRFGLNLLSAPSPEATIFLLSGLDAIVFLAWIWHEEKYKKIKSFF